MVVISKNEGVTSLAQIKSLELSSVICNFAE